MDAETRQAIGELHEKINKANKTLSRLEVAVCGNGTKGLADRVNELEEIPGKNKRFLIPIIVTVLIALSSIGWHIIEKLIP